jgi:diguanylate cyclase (GGDEF)-like protein
VGWADSRGEARKAVVRGIHIPEERRLAGSLAAALYITASLTAGLVLVLPGVEVDSAGVVLGLSGVGLVWGLIALRLIPWERANPVVSLLSSFMGLPITAIVMAETGGSHSPARFYLLFIVFYCSYFYRRGEAAVLIGLCMAVQCSPLLYESGAVDNGFLAELFVVLPSYVVLGGLISLSKDLMVTLREESTALSLSDALTGVANRRAFEAGLEMMEKGGRASDVTGLLLVDLDDFKSANTLFGHTGGDRVLRCAADSLREAARGNDMVARLGGDEFAILAGAVTEEGMTALADRVLESLARADEALSLPGFRLSASVGWAVYPYHADNGRDLIEHADFALAGAKASGKARWQAAVSHPSGSPGSRVGADERARRF